MGKYILISFYIEDSNFDECHLEDTLKAACEVEGLKMVDGTYMSYGVRE